MVNRLFNETVEFKRNSDVFFSGLVGLTNAIVHSESDRPFRVTILNSSGITGTLTFNGLRNSSPVTAVATLTGDDDTEITNQKFDSITDFSSIHASAPTITVGLVAKGGEPIEQVIAVLTTKANFSVRRRLQILPTGEPGVLPAQESVIRIPGSAGATVANGDFFIRFNENFQVGEPEPIRKINAPALFDHYEFVCHKIT